MLRVGGWGGSWKPISKSQLQIFLVQSWTEISILWGGGERGEGGLDMEYMEFGAAT